MKVPIENYFSCLIENYFSYKFLKTYAVGTKRAASMRQFRGSQTRFLESMTKHPVAGKTMC